jgi:hypothetical protein
MPILEWSSILASGIRTSAAYLGVVVVNRPLFFCAHRFLELVVSYALLGLVVCVGQLVRATKFELLIHV